jgi:hypothetical protein
VTTEALLEGEGGGSRRWELRCLFRADHGEPGRLLWRLSHLLTEGLWEGCE